MDYGLAAFLRSIPFSFPGFRILHRIHHYSQRMGELIVKLLKEGPADKLCYRFLRRLFRYLAFRIHLGTLRHGLTENAKHFINII